MRAQQPRLFVVDDDRAVLSLAGTTLTCLDVLQALRSVSPQCEVVLLTGYDNLHAAVDALKHSLPDGAGREPSGAVVSQAALPAPLVDVERDHILRTLTLVHGNKAAAARLLGLSRRALYRQLERHGLHHRVPVARHEAVAVASSSESRQ